MGNKQGAAAAIGFFRDDYPHVAPLHILGGTRVSPAACGLAALLLRRGHGAGGGA